MQAVVKRRTGAAALLAVAFTARLWAGETAMFAMRTHYCVEAGDHAQLYKVTAMSRTSESEDETLWLVEDALTAERFVLRKTIDFAELQTRYEISAPEGRSAIAASYLLPFGDRTRSGTLKAFHRMTPQQFAQMDTEWTLNSGGMKVTAKNSEWKNEIRAREWRTELRRTTSPQLLEAVERMSGALFNTPELEPFCQAVSAHLLHREMCTRPATALVHIPPECDFDAAFGYACSTKQIDAVRKSKDEKRDLRVY